MHFAEESMSVATQLNIVNLLLTAIDTHVTEAKVVRNACMTLAYIVEEDGWFLVQFVHINWHLHVL